MHFDYQHNAQFHLVLFPGWVPVINSLTWQANENESNVSFKINIEYKTVDYDISAQKPMDGNFLWNSKI